jgi:DNA polymerase
MTREELEVVAAVRRLVAAEIAAGRGRVIDAELQARLAPAGEPARAVAAADASAPARSPAPSSIAAPAPAPARAAAPPPLLPPAAGPDQAERAARLAALIAEAEACTRCALATTRTKVVVGVGRLDPGLMLVGEAPGADEDRVGEPFVGRAGQLLTRILAAIGLERGDVYIANVLKCRPPENRNPLPGEIAACSPYLAEQIAIVRPRVIAALGRFAAATLLRTHQTTLSALRGRIHDYQGIPVIVTYHPSALLRYPMYKKPTWEDMQVIQRLLAGQSAAEALVAASPAS